MTSTNHEPVDQRNGLLAPPRRVRSPGGLRERHRIRLRQPGDAVDAGATLTLSGTSTENVMAMHVKPSLMKSTNWIAAAWTLNESGIPVSSFRTRLVVPPEPSSRRSQLLFLFPGMEPSRTASLQTILQPVLQWGDSGKDDDGINRTGAFWSVASWLVPDVNGDAHHTPHVRVSPGDTLTGQITLLQGDFGLFSYACEFLEVPETRLEAASMPELVWCVETLEAYEQESPVDPPYDLDSRSEYPNAPRTAFTDISVVAGNAETALEWTLDNAVSAFGEAAEVVDASRVGGRIDIVY